ncbi:hypothetical protein GN244_ATG14126 [Phytophthora infestans]|uniref:Uncharacterized protein n=1 Tax=Phytophthora infestans TaxID=4787 RepID=A0A833SFW9_PHYIN|nr:hypothetical protein GN244_ATG14126 [Phytophthora infestans]
MSVSDSTVRRIYDKQPADFCSTNATATRRRRVEFPELERQLVDISTAVSRPISSQTTCYCLKLEI